MVEWVFSSLHMNFYEDWQPPESIEDGAPKIEEIIAKLESL